MAGRGGGRGGGGGFGNGGGGGRGGFGGAPNNSGGGGNFGGAPNPKPDRKAGRRAAQQAVVDKKVREMSEYFFRARAEEVRARAGGKNNSSSLNARAIRAIQDELFDPNHGSSGIRFDDYAEVGTAAQVESSCVDP